MFAKGTRSVELPKQLSASSTSNAGRHTQTRSVLRPGGTLLREVVDHRRVGPIRMRFVRVGAVDDQEPGRAEPRPAGGRTGPRCQGSD